MSGIRLRAYLWLLMMLGVIGMCTLQFYHQSPLQTNLLSLLPATERNPVAEEAVTRLANIAGNRAIFLIGHASTESAMLAANAFASSLEQSKAFHQVIANIPAIDPKELVEVYVHHRFHLLTERDRHLLTNEQVNLDERLQKKLYVPFQFGLTVPIAEDPFGFLDNWIGHLPLRSLKLEPENGMLVTRSIQNHGVGHASTEKTWVFVSAELGGSAYDNIVQNDVVSAVLKAKETLTKASLEAEVLYTGTVFYADDARANAEREIDFIGVGSLVGMLALLYFVFRSVRPLALGLLSVAFGIGAAVAFTISMYGQIHLITLVFGASLIGEAIDYPIQYFAAHLGTGKDWAPITGLKRITPGLTVALVTSLLGYSALMFAPFPALAQIGLFALVGLSAAWLSVFLLLPALLVKPNTRDPEVAVARPKLFLTWWKTHMDKRECYVVVIIILAIALPGWLQLTSNDDVRLLIAKPSALVTQEEIIRELTGIGNESQFFLIEGATVDAVLHNEEMLTQRLAPLMQKAEISGYQGISSFLPSLATQEKNHALWASKVFNDKSVLQTTLINAGLYEDVGEQLINAFDASAKQPLLLEDWLKSPIANTAKNLWLGKTDQGFAAIGLPRNIRNTDSVKLLAEKIEGVTFVDKAGSTSQLLKNYRQWGGLWLLGVITLIYLALVVRYQWAQAAVVLTPAVIAIVLTFGLFGHFHIPLSLFHLMALMLVLGVGVNYAIFLREGGAYAAASLSGVLLSAGTTLLSFGLLAFTSMPALSSFGLTLLLGVGIAVLLAPMVLSFEAEHA
jgi:predicted exporter